MHDFFAAETSLSVEGEQLEMGGGGWPRWCRNVDFAAWLDEAVIVASDLAKKLVENDGLPVNGMPKTPLSYFIDRTRSDGLSIFSLWAR